MIYLVLFLLTITLKASDLSLQQTHNIALSNGFPSNYYSLYQQHSVFSKNQYHLASQVQCKNQHCNFKRLQLGINPSNYQLYLGYLKQFQNPLYKGLQPFVGVAFNYPHAPQHNRACRIQPWLLSTNKQPVQLLIKDNDQDLLLTHTDSGYSSFNNAQLPYGNYPVYLQSTALNGTQNTQYQYVNNASTPVINQPYTLQLQLGAATKNLQQRKLQENIQTSITQNIPNHLGQTTTYIGYIQEKAYLSLGHTFYLTDITIQPTLGWTQNRRISNQLFSFSAQAHWQINDQLQYQIHSYLQHEYQLELIHQQLQLNTEHFTLQSLWHYHQQPSKRYWQLAVQQAHTTSPFGIPMQTSLMLNQHYNKSPTVILRFSMKPKKHSQLPHIKFIGSNKTQSAELNWPLTDITQVQTKYKHQHNTHWLSGGIRQQLPIGHLHSKLSHSLNQTRNTIYLTRIKSGLTITHDHIIWHPLNSPWQAKELQITTDSERMFWWGSQQQLKQKGCYIKHLPNYTPVVKDHGESYTLYPGNVQTHYAL